MKLCFTRAELEAGLNIMELEDIKFSAELLWRVGERLYRMSGSAVVEGETYPEFELEFETEGEPAKPDSCESILELEWVDYRFIFEV